MVNKDFHNANTCTYIQVAETDGGSIAVEVTS